MTNSECLTSSFRDPSGFVFKRDGVLYRQINHAYADHYGQLMDSGLYSALVKDGLLVAHEEVDISSAQPDRCHKIIQPAEIPFISYPYEWSFSMLKAAALATLDIQLKALEFGMVLKDASSYNIQFLNAQPIFIDTLSFEPYCEGEPWVGYQQFCKHFLAPLALMSKTDIHSGQWSRVFIDGVPLDLASKLLPFSSRLNMGLLMHIHIHAKSQTRHASDVTQESVDEKAPKFKGKLSQRGMLGVIDNLQSTVRKLRWNDGSSEWAHYYDATNYSDDAMEEKERLVSHYLDRISPTSVWDMGANNGQFSRLASRRGIPTVSFDIDPAAVEHNFLRSSNNNEKNMLPLLLDITNPSPAIGWANAERDTVAARGPAHTAFALALVHHLAISNNVPLSMLADYFAQLCNYLIIEFVPKSDSQVRTLLATREDIFPEYTSAGFEEAFSACFTILESVPVAGSDRTLYLMENNAPKR